MSQHPRAARGESALPGGLVNNSRLRRDRSRVAIPKLLNVARQPTITLRTLLDDTDDGAAFQSRALDSSRRATAKRLLGQVAADTPKLTAAQSASQSAPTPLPEVAPATLLAARSHEPPPSPSRRTSLKLRSNCPSCPAFLDSYLQRNPMVAPMPREVTALETRRPTRDGATIDSWPSLISG